MPVKPRGNGFEAGLAHEGRRWRFMFKTEEAAKGWLADAKAALANGRAVPDPDETGTTPRTQSGVLTLAKACDQFWNHAYAPSKSDWPKTVNLYLGAMQRFFPDHTLEEISKQTKADEFLADLYKRGQAQSTINAKIGIYSKLMDWAQKRGHIRDRPEMVVARPDNMRSSYLTEDEEVAALQLLRTWELHEVADAVVVLVDTGMRPSELWRLIGRDYSTTTGKITVRKSKNGDPRTVPATLRVRTILNRRIQAQGAGDKVMPTLSNRRLQAAWGRVRTKMERDTDPDFIPYILRHTCASRLAQRGIPLGVIMTWMGHKSIQVTMRYAKFSPSDLDAAADALEAPIKRNLRVINGGTPE